MRIWETRAKKAEAALASMEREREAERDSAKLHMIRADEEHERAEAEAVLYRRASRDRDEARAMLEWAEEALNRPSGPSGFALSFPLVRRIYDMRLELERLTRA